MLDGSAHQIVGMGVSPPLPLLGALPGASSASSQPRPPFHAQDTHSLPFPCHRCAASCSLELRALAGPLPCPDPLPFLQPSQCAQPSISLWQRPPGSSVSLACAGCLMMRRGGGRGVPDALIQVRNIGFNEVQNEAVAQ